jgi:uncharacterized protein (DUF1800 family)
MLPATPDTFRVALNRVTFGARDTDVQAVRSSGWSSWVNTQLAPPAGDDPALATYISSQTMPIKYAAGTGSGKWAAVDTNRPLNYLNASIETLWNMAINNGTLYSPYELLRVKQELAAATWIRNTHSRFQLREFMVDFWQNHFNIGKNEQAMSSALLPVFDRVVIRPNVFGNFYTLLRATAGSTSMLVYLDNWVSTAATPNENYAREIIELHTLGGDAYRGTASPASVPKGADGIAVGYTDQDVVMASRALSGWTVEYGQLGNNGRSLPSTGKFLFNLRQHNTTAGMFLGFNLASLTTTDMSQGEKVIEIIAKHPSTATFIVTKLAKRIFGDTPPQAVIDRGVAAWMANLSASNQIAQVLRAILLNGDEVLTAPVAKVRRPYERIIAVARTTEMTVRAASFMTTMLDPLCDGLGAWPAPNGRPDNNGYWLSTGSLVTTWNLISQLMFLNEFAGGSLNGQAPASAESSATTIVEYWVNRMVGYSLRSAAMSALIYDQGFGYGVPSMVKKGTALQQENAHRRLVSLIATSEEFALR